MRRLKKEEVRAYLARNGIGLRRKADEIISGFDFSQPVLEQFLDPGQLLRQFIRNPDYQSSGKVGNWFALASATQPGLAIFGGGAGRRAHQFRVAYPFMALEGTAAALPRNWAWAGGGPGGHTQVYVPTRFLGHLASLGPE